MMSGQVEMTNPVDTSVGGMRGHLLRRGVHLSMVGIPYLYFAHGENVADTVGVSLPQWWQAWSSLPWSSKDF